VSFRNIISASLALATGGWEHRIQGNYRNGYTDVPYSASDCVFTNDAGDCVAGALHVPSYYTFDWATSYTFEGTTLTFGIRNLLDKNPPLSLQVFAGHQLGYDPRYASAELRTFTLGASIKY
jgi:iron complex outermembrane receptor protein